jgi:hypothetical protein
MRIVSDFIAVALFTGIGLVGLPSGCFPQQSGSSPEVARGAAELPEAPLPQGASGGSSSQQPQAGPGQASQKPSAESPAMKTPPPETKRILGMIPNYRVVSAGQTPPPPTAHEAFMIATETSFDYSAFFFVGVTSLLAEGTDSHPVLGKGVGGFWAYYWRGYLDKTDANYMTDFVLPTILHQDSRYYAKGTGGVWKRSIYAASRVLITPNYHEKNTFNTSEILGRGISEGISLSYYPSQTRTAAGIAEKYGYALGRDALSNVFRELWPDIRVHVLHRQR